MIENHEILDREPLSVDPAPFTTASLTIPPEGTTDDPLSIQMPATRGRVVGASAPDDDFMVEAADHWLVLMPGESGPGGLRPQVHEGAGHGAALEPIGSRLAARAGSLAPRPVGAGGRDRRRKLWRLGIVGAVLAGAVAFLLVKGLGGSLDYFETVDQALAQRHMLTGKTIRLEGLVQPGTRDDIAGGVEFWADGTHGKVLVVSHGEPPQLFSDGIPVVVQGHFSGAAFMADQIIVDHTNQYIEQHLGRVRAPDGSVR